MKYCKYSFADKQIIYSIFTIKIDSLLISFSSDNHIHFFIFKNSNKIFTCLKLD